MNRISLLITILVLPETIFAQQNCNTQSANPDCDNGWFSVSFGGDIDPNLDFNAAVTANIGRDIFWRFSATGRSSFQGSTSIGSIDIMRGKSIVDRIGRVSIAAGLSLLNFQNYDYQDQSVFKPGVTIVTEALFSPAKEIGFGVDIIATSAQKYSSIGLRIVFAIEGHK